jgi:thiamine biosynthesis lipoprotein ApbE
MSALSPRSSGSQLLMEDQEAFAAWQALGMLIQIVVTSPSQLAAARELLAADLAALDRACSRFRADSELVAVGNAARGASGPVTVAVSPLLAEAVAVSLRAAQLTDGDVDPTVGGALAALGYDRDFGELAQTDKPQASHAVHRGGVGVRVIPGWRSVSVDVAARRLTVPSGVQLVSLGGDTAVAGAAPDGGWRVRVQDRTGLPGQPADGPSQVVAIRDGGLATSSTAARRWRHGGDVLHHILDPRTGLPAAPVWRTVSVAAGTCADANTAATAAIIRGSRAPAWLSGLNLPARLVAHDGTVATLAGWPESQP